MAGHPGPDQGGRRDPAVAVLLHLQAARRSTPRKSPRWGPSLLLAGEAIYGLALGLIVALLFSVVQLSGRIAEQQMGMTMSEIVDPLKGEETGELSSLLEMIFILLFLSANGHHLFLLILSKSYDAFPPGTMPTLDRLVEGVVETGSVMFIASLRLAAPLLGAFLVLMVALALLARLVPEMDISDGQHAGAGGPGPVPGGGLPAVRRRVRDGNGRLDGQTAADLNRYRL